MAYLISNLSFEMVILIVMRRMEKDGSRKNKL